MDYETEIENLISISFDSTRDAHSRSQLKKSLFQYLHNGYSSSNIFHKLHRHLHNVIRLHCGMARAHAAFTEKQTPQERAVTTLTEYIDHMSTAAVLADLVQKAANTTIHLESASGVCKATPWQESQSIAHLIRCTSEAMQSFTQGEPMFIQRIMCSMHAYVGTVSLILQYVSPSRAVLLQALCWCDRMQQYLRIIATGFQKLMLFRRAAQKSCAAYSGMPGLRVVYFEIFRVRRMIVPLLTTVEGSRALSENEACAFDKATLVRELNRPVSADADSPEECILQNMQRMTESKGFRRCAIPHIGSDFSAKKESSSTPLSTSSSFFTKCQTFERDVVTNTIGSRIINRLHPGLFSAFRPGNHLAKKSPTKPVRISYDQTITTNHYQQRAHYEIVLQSLIVQLMEESESAKASEISVAYVRSFINALEDCAHDHLVVTHFMSKLSAHLEMVLSSAQISRCHTIFDILLNISLAVSIRRNLRAQCVSRGILSVGLSVLWMMAVNRRRYYSLWYAAWKFVLVFFPKGASLHPQILSSMFEDASVHSRHNTSVIDWLLSSSADQSLLENSSELPVEFLLKAYMRCNRPDHSAALFSKLFWAFTKHARFEGADGYCVRRKALYTTIHNHNAGLLLELFVRAQVPLHTHSLLAHPSNSALALLKSFCYRQTGLLSKNLENHMRAFVQCIASCQVKRQGMAKELMQSYGTLQVHANSTKHVASVILYLINSDQTEMRGLGASLLGDHICAFARRCASAAGCVVNILPQRLDSKSVLIIMSDGGLRTLKTSALADVFFDRVDPIADHLRVIHDMMHSVCTSAYPGVRSIYFQTMRRLFSCMQEDGRGHHDRILVLLNVNLAYYFHVHSAEMDMKLMFEVASLILREIGYPTPQCNAKTPRTVTGAFGHSLRNVDLNLIGLIEQFCANDFIVDRTLLAKVSLPILFTIFRTLSLQSQQHAAENTMEVDDHDDIQLHRYAFLVLVICHPEASQGIESSVWLSLMEDMHPIVAIVAAREFLRAFQTRHKKLFATWENIFVFQPEAYKNMLFRFLDSVMEGQTNFDDSEVKDEKIEYQRRMRKKNGAQSTRFIVATQGFVKIYYLKRMYEAKILNRI